MFVQRQELPPGSSRALGWDTPSDQSSAGTLMSAQSFGHTGFTGTSIWIDPTRDLVVVVLSNRVHPTRANNRWGATVRGGIADRAVQAVSGAGQ
jgi:CubicO group peptidase (beta-lactamase class C family)